MITRTTAFVSSARKRKCTVMGSSTSGGDSGGKNEQAPKPFRWTAHAETLLRQGKTDTGYSVKYGSNKCWPSITYLSFNCPRMRARSQRRWGRCPDVSVRPIMDELTDGMPPANRMINGDSIATEMYTRFPSSMDVSSTIKQRGWAAAGIGLYVVTTRGRHSDVRMATASRSDAESAGFRQQ